MILAADRAAAGSRPRARGRRARAHLPRGRSSAGPRAWHSPVYRSRHRGQRFPARAAARRRPATAGCRRKARTSRARSPRAAAWIVDPIDGTRAYHRRPRRTGRFRSALVETAGRCGRAVCAGDRRDVPRRAAVARRSTACRSTPAPAAVRRRALRRPQPMLERIAGRPASSPNPRNRFAGAAVRAVAQGALDAAFAPATAMTGTLRPPTFWCTKPAGR